LVVALAVAQGGDSGVSEWRTRTRGLIDFAMFFVFAIARASSTLSPPLSKTRLRLFARAWVLTTQFWVLGYSVQYVTALNVN
jgi:hypothetical protein